MQDAVSSKQSKSPHPPFSKGGQGGDLVLLQLQWLLDAVARTSLLVRGARSDSGFRILVARTSLLVRGRDSSLLLHHGQTRRRRASKFVRATVCPCHLSLVTRHLSLSVEHRPVLGMNLHDLAHGRNFSGRTPDNSIQLFPFHSRNAAEFLHDPEPA